MTYQPLELQSNPDESIRDRFLKVLDYANCAPSVFHSKPWLFRMVGDQLSIYKDTSKQVSGLDDNQKLMIINIGILIDHIHTVMRYFNLVPDITTFPDLSNPDLLADIRIKKEDNATHDEIQMFNTLRSPWNSINTQNHPKRTDTDFVCQLGCQIKSNWIKMCCECDIENLSKLNSNPTEKYKQHIAKTPLKGFINDKSIIYPEALIDYQPYFMKACSHILLHTPQNNAVAWLQAGIELSNLLLLLKKHGLVGMIIPWAVEHDEYKNQMNCISDTDNYPQVLIRVYQPNNIGILPASQAQNLMYFSN